MIDKRIDDKEAQDLKKVFEKTLHKTGDIMKNTQFNVEDVFSGILGIHSIPSEQKTKLISFKAKLM